LRETAGRELPHLQMIGDALTADPFAGTGAVGAIACLKIFLLIAFHYFYLLMTPDRNS